MSSISEAEQGVVPTGKSPTRIDPAGINARPSEYFMQRYSRGEWLINLTGTVSLATENHLEPFLCSPIIFEFPFNVYLNIEAFSISFRELNLSNAFN